MKQILIIPDAHVSQEQNHTRFAKLGNLIVEKQPETIISMGDFLTLKSISHWDQNKGLTMEGRRYKEEIQAGNLALNMLEHPLRKLQERQRDNKTRQYRPRKIYLEGNHESWIDKYVEQNPQLEGHVNLREDLRLDKRGWDVVRYKSYIELGGCLFTHVPMAANAQPVSGINALRTALSLSAKSLVFAHTHRLETANFKRHGTDELIQGLTCGCFFEGEDEYAVGAANHYWRGIVLLNIIRPGKFDIETISLERLYAEY